MKNSNFGITLLMLFMTATIASIIAILGTTTSVAYANHEFETNMTGQQEVPPVNTQAVGEAFLANDVPVNGTIYYYVNVTGIQGATQGHIHSGAQGQNGPVIVTLFNFSTPQYEVLQKGAINTTDLEGPMQGKTIDDLVAAMKNGSTYVNVHTEQNPKGEIRGQLVNIP